MTWIKTHLTLLGIIGLALVVAGLFMYRDHALAKKDAAHVQAADADQAGAHKEASKAQDDIKPMADERTQIGKDMTVNQGIDARIAADRARAFPGRPQPIHGPGLPDIPAAEPVSEPVESPREMGKDQLISDLTTALVDRDATIADQAKLIASSADYGQHMQDAYTQDDAAVNEMRQAVHPHYARAAGFLYAPGQSAVGVIVEQDIARVRVVG